MKKILLICLVLIVLGIGIASVSAEDDFDTVITTAGEPDSTDLIPITDPESGELIPITPGFEPKQIMITVESNPSTPFTWIVSNETYGVVLDKEYFVPYNPGSLGGAGTEYFIFNITSDDFYVKVIEISLETKEPTGKYVEKTSQKPLPPEIIPVIIDEDTLILSAKESGSVPYRWEVSDDTYGVELINTTYEQYNPGLAGSSGVRSFIFKILNPDDYYAKIIEVSAITKEPTGKYVENSSASVKPVEPEEEVQNSSENQMEPTGLPILALLLALFVIPLGYRKK